VPFHLSVRFCFHGNFFFFFMVCCVKKKQFEVIINLSLWPLPFLAGPFTFHSFIFHIFTFHVSRFRVRVDVSLLFRLVCSLFFLKYTISSL
jgi:hypothetical protein